MPGSFEGARPEVLEYIKQTIRPKKILDVGPGRGTYADLIVPAIPKVQIDAIEIFEPYVDMFGLKSKYDNVWIADMREWNNYNYDLVIFGDCLEHIYLEEAVELWQTVKDQAGWVIIACPVIHWEQGAEYGNVHETHLHHYNMNEIHEVFGEPKWEKRVVEVASFIYKFKEEKNV